MNANPYVPEPCCCLCRVIFHELHVFLHLQGSKHNLNGICPVPLGNTTGAHISITYGLDLFNPVLLGK